MEILADLRDEQDRLEAILAGLDEAAWSAPSGAPGWSIVDVVLHLAQSEETVVASLTGAGGGLAVPPGVTGGLDDLMDRFVEAERAGPATVFPRWQAARRAALAALESADPRRSYPWAAAPLQPRTLATTRLAEHWAHGLDVTAPLGIPFPDTARLRHIAWLGHRTLQYGFTLAGLPPQEVYCELTGPGGEPWRYGPAGAESAIRGPAGAFCRVGAQRLAPADSGLVTSGPHGEAALGVLRNYAA